MKNLYKNFTTSIVLSVMLLTTPFVAPQQAKALTRNQAAVCTLVLLVGATAVVMCCMNDLSETSGKKFDKVTDAFSCHRVDNPEEHLDPSILDEVEE